MKKPAYTPRDQVKALRQTLTQKQAAKKLGVSERTIRRWENGEKWAPTARAPVQPKADNQKRLTKRAAAQRTAIRQNNEKVAQGDLTPKGVPVMPIASRRVLKKYRAGKVVPGVFTEGQWVNYNVEHLSRDDMLAFLETYRGKFYRAQFIFKAPATDPYLRNRTVEPEEDEEDEESEKITWVHSASGVEALWDIDTKEQMGGLLDQYFFRPFCKPLYIGILKESRPVPAKKKRAARKKK